MRSSGLSALVAVVTVLLLCPARPARAASPSRTLNVRWGDGYESLRFEFRGSSYEYPRQLVGQAFPPAGGPPRIEVTTDWPIVTVRARWSVSTADWPRDYRDEAVGLILLFACDAALYSRIFPESIVLSGFTAPPEFAKQTNEPYRDLPGALRGGRLAYAVTASAGFGAADYEIRTEIRIGAGGQGRTAFYHDKPSHISDHLVNRELVFIACDAGDEIHLELVSFCVCEPRVLFRGEAMSRVRRQIEYMVNQMYRHLACPPTGEQVEDYCRRIGLSPRGKPARPDTPIPTLRDGNASTDSPGF